MNNYKTGRKSIGNLSERMLRSREQDFFLISDFTEISVNLSNLK